MAGLNDFADALKNAGLVLTTVSGVGYACGYLVMRARAFALGTDPGFALVDQAYVWAGIRLAMMLLFAAWLSALPVLLLREVWHLLLHAAPRAIVLVERSALLIAGIATIVAAIRLFAVSHLIFELPAAARGLPAAALGRNSYGTVLFVASTALLLVSSLWLRSHLARAGMDAVMVLLIALTALLCLLLPIQHGVFFADRKLRQLDHIPAGVTGLVPPAWVIDRGADGRVVLFGRNGSGQPRLVPMKAETLDGIAVTAVADLGDVLIREVSRMNSGCNVPASAGSQAPPSMPTSGATSPGPAQTFWNALSQINMLFVRAGNLAGGATQGAIWRLVLASGATQRIGHSDTLSWPVAATAGGPVFALRGQQLVRLGSDGSELQVGDTGAWHKLLGAMPDGSVLGFVAGAPRERAARLSPDGVLEVFDAPDGGEDRRRDGVALQEERDYADDTRLHIRRSERGGQGFDIFLVTKTTQRNLTDCGNDRCGQPSLTADGDAVLYIRAAP